MQAYQQKLCLSSEAGTQLVDFTELCKCPGDPNNRHYFARAKQMILSQKLQRRQAMQLTDTNQGLTRAQRFQKMLDNCKDRPRTEAEKRQDHLNDQQLFDDIKEAI